MGKGIWTVGWDLNLERDLHQKIGRGVTESTGLCVCPSVFHKITHQHSLMRVCAGRSLMGMDGVKGNIRGMNIS